MHPWQNLCPQRVTAPPPLEPRVSKQIEQSVSSGARPSSCCDCGCGRGPAPGPAGRSAPGLWSGGGGGGGRGKGAPEAPAPAPAPAPPSSFFTTTSRAPLGFFGGCCGRLAGRPRSGAAGPSSFSSSSLSSASSGVRWRGRRRLRAPRRAAPGSVSSMICELFLTE